MNWVEALRKAITTKFKNEFDLLPQSQIDYGDNKKAFKPPVDGSSWVRINWEVLDNVNAEIGTGFQRARCLLTVQCFTKEFIGEESVDALVFKCGEIFQNKNFDGVKVFAMTPLKVGANNNWFQKNAKFDFTYDVFS